MYCQQCGEEMDIISASQRLVTLECPNCYNEEIASQDEIEERLYQEYNWVG